MRSAIGRVLRGAVPIGGACRVAPELAITCGHVVDFARPAGAQGPAEVTVDFPWSQTPAPSPATVVASTSQGLQGGDVALLRLAGPPVGAPLLPALGAHAAGDPVSACGFPADTPQGAIGQWAYGHVQDARLDGWVQLNDADTTGYWVKPGFSGTPVWAHDGRVVVGMTVAVDTSAGHRIAYFVPLKLAIDQLLALSPDEAGLLALRRRYAAERGPDIATLADGAQLNPSALEELVLLLEPGEALVAVLGCQAALPVQLPPGMALLAVTDRRVLFVTKSPALRRLGREWRIDELRRFDLVPSGFGRGRSPLGDALRVRSRDRGLSVIELLPAGREHEMVDYVAARRTELARLL